MNKKDVSTIAPDADNKGEKSELRTWIVSVGWLGWLAIGIVCIGLKTYMHKGHISIHGTPTGKSIFDALKEFSADFLGELGVAVFVFATVSVTIEYFTRARIENEDKKRIEKYDRKFDELIARHQSDKSEIKAELFKSVFGIAVDKSVVDGVIDTLFRENFFRTNLKVEYIFDCLEDHPNILKCREILRFRNHNNGNQESILDLGYSSENIFTYEQLHDNIIGVQVLNSKGERIVKVDGNETNILRNGISTTLTGDDLKVSVPPRDYVDVYFENITYRRCCDRLSFISLSAAADLKIFVIDNTKWALTFDVETAHKYLAEEELYFNEDQRHKRWHIKHAILPGNGVNVSWYLNTVK